MKRLPFNAFMMNANSRIHHGQWRRPDRLPASHPAATYRGAFPNEPRS